jgi:predicted phage terminase large subunit-like protein
VAPEADREAVNELGAPILPAAADGTTLADVPLRMRSGSNPGGVGHEWVRGRFVDQETRRSSAVFVPAKLSDNPSIDRKAYRQALGELTEVERQRLEEGDWDVADDGDVFERSWFRIVDEVAADCRWVRYWDMAATAPKPAERGKKRKTDPDWSVGALVGLDREGRWWIKDVVRFRKKPHESELVLKQVAALDGRRVPVRMEQEPGSSGVTAIDNYRRDVFVGFDFDGHRPTLSKEERAAPVARAAQAGNVSILSAPWNREFLDEAAGFPHLPHDDQVDAVSGGFDVLVSRPRARIIA